MLREGAMNRNLGADPEFRWRGTSVGRLEGFSDAVFAFAVTLLVVSLEVPRTFDQLMVTMRGFIAFAICFTFLVGIWYTHYSFFRRYGLVNPYTTFLNSILLFLVLFYVYPLKFLFTLLVDQFWGVSTTTLSDGSVVRVMNFSDMPTLMVIYSLGYLAVFLVFALLYHHAYRQRSVLELNETEIHITREAIQRKYIYLAFGLTSICIALFAPSNFVSFSGMIYMLVGPVIAVHATRMARARQRLASKDSGSHKDD